MKFILVLIILLYGCTIMENPKQNGGLLSTATNIINSSYDKRLQKRQKTLDEIQAKKQDLVKDTKRLESEKLNTSQQIKIEKRKLTEIDNNIKILEKKLKNDKAILNSNKKNRARKLRQLKKLKNRNKKLQRKINAKNNKDAIRSIQAERDNLDKELSLLLETSQ